MRTQAKTKGAILFTAILAVMLIVPGLVRAGSLEPSAPPGPTMHTLDEIYHKLEIIEANLGVGLRFVDNGNGTVTDRKTGLIWLKNADPWGLINWNDAMAYCASLASGQAGLTDGSTAGQWRLPSKEELTGIGSNPPTTWDSAPPGAWTVPGAPFTNVQSHYYWSSTTYAVYPYDAWVVYMGTGYVAYNDKSSSNYYAWPVRAGQ